MKKKRNNNYYNFTYYNNNYKRRKNNLNKMRVVATLMIILITIILIIVTRSIENNIKTAEQQEQAIKEAELEKQKIKEEEEKKKEEAAKKEAERQAKLPKLTDVGRKNMDNIYHSEKKRAFLTFDDGPSQVTPQILDTLKKEKVKATFFMLGTSVENFPETTKRVYEEGHYIANHGYSHVYSSIYSSPEEVLNEYNMCNNAVKNAIGEPEYNSHLFRYPGGYYGGPYAEIKEQAKQILEENDILNVDWNALTGDAESQDPQQDQLMDKLMETTEGKSSVVILMHDAQAKKVTADMLPQIISYLREQGYEFKTFYDIIK